MFARGSRLGVLRVLAVVSLVLVLVALTVWMVVAAAAPVFDPSLVPGPGLPPSRAPHPEVRTA